MKSKLVGVKLIGENLVRVYDWGTDIGLPDGKRVLSAAEDTDGYRARAEEYGFDSPDHMAREHDLTHAMLAGMLGLRESPALRRVADGKEPTDLTDLEEAAVMAIHKFYNKYKEIQHNEHNE